MNQSDFGRLFSIMEEDEICLEREDILRVSSKRNLYQHDALSSEFKSRLCWKVKV